MEALIHWLYVYCTDFIINLANGTGTSYYEVNVVLFCFLYPLFIIGSPLLYFLQRWRLRRLKKQINKLA